MAQTSRRDPLVLVDTTGHPERTGWHTAARESAAAMRRPFWASPRFGPLYYEVQGRHYMAVMDLNRVYFCCLYYLELKEEKGRLETEAKRPKAEMDRMKAIIVADMESSCTAVCEDASGSYTVTFNPSYKEGILKDSLLRLKESHLATIEGIRGYLTSGLLKGIGPKTAEAIIQRFGIQSLYVLEHQPEKLLEIRGITEDRLEEIKSGYAQSKAMRDLMTLLAPLKVTPTTAMKIYEHFGPNGVELLRKSPFRL